MFSTLFITQLAVLIALTPLITYYDVRYRRIPNAFVLCTLISGIAANVMYGGWHGFYASIVGCVIGFALLLTVRFFTAMGAGDVKLFGAIGALLGIHLVLPTFLIIVITGGVLATCSMLLSETVKQTMFGVWQIFASLLPGRRVIRAQDLIAGGKTVPYGVAITLGSLISVALSVKGP